MNPSDMKPSDIVFRTGASALPGTLGKIELEYAAALYIWFCKEHDDKWTPLGWPEMKVFLVGKIDLMLEEINGEAKPTLPVWFRAACGINMKPDFGGLFDKGYMRTIDGHALTVQQMLPTLRLFEAIFVFHSSELSPDTTENDSGSGTPDLPNFPKQTADAFKMKRDLAKQQRVCAICSGPAVSFDDEPSAREYEITALCQTCQKNEVQEPCLRALQAQAHGNSREKGWWEAQTIEGEIDLPSAIASIPEKLCLIHSETSEALEDYRNLPASHEGSLLAIRVVRLDEKGAPVGFAIEIADIVIRVLDLAGALGIDLQKAVEVKMAYNATRPHRHGGKRA